MKKIHLSLLFIFLLNIVNSQIIDGTYESKQGTILKIENDKYFFEKTKKYKNLNFIEMFSHSEGLYKNEGNHITLNSNNINKIKDTLIKIKKIKKIKNDSVTLNLIYRDPKDIIVYICNFKILSSDIKYFEENYDNCIEIENYLKMRLYDGDDRNIEIKIFPNYNTPEMRRFHINSSSLSFSYSKIFESGNEYDLIINNRLFYWFNFEEFNDEIALIKEDHIFFKGEKFYKKE